MVAPQAGSRLFLANNSHPALAGRLIYYILNLHHATHAPYFPGSIGEYINIPKDVPHPVKTLTDSVFLKGRAANIPVTYIHTVAANTDAAKDDFASQAERARKRGWPVVVLAADHNPQITNPPALVEMLYKYR
jgi:hypothetical protein